jgi:hypothetical protein
MLHPEITPENRENSKLIFAASLTETLVPGYDIRQSDPIKAAKDGIGNCVAKAAISAVMLEQAQFVGATPALAWNTNTHPKHGIDVLGNPRILNGHAYLLASDNRPPYKISGLSFNPDGISSNNWEIFEFNDDGEFATVVNDNIVATPAGTTVGYIIDDWHAGGRQYQEALGITESIYHQTTRKQLSSMIVDLLADKDMLLRFSDFR